jgi:hypothetical protein
MASVTPRASAESSSSKEEGESTSIMRPDADADEEEISDSTSTFRWSQFLTMLLPQCFLPFSLPIVALFSPGAALNFAGIPKPPSIVFLVVFFPLVLFLGAAPVVTIVAWLMSPSDTDTVVAGTLRADAIHVAASYACLRLAICVKYAFIPHTKFMQRLRTWASSQERNDEQLISGWMNINRATIVREVAVAVLRHSSYASAQLSLKAKELPRLYAILDSPDARAIIVQSLVSEVETGDEKESSSTPSSPFVSTPDAIIHIPVSTFAEALETAAQSRVKLLNQWTSALFFFLSILTTFASTIIRRVYHEPIIGSTTIQHVIIIGHWISNFLVMGVTYNFLIIGAVDHRRRASSLEILGRCFSTGVRNGRATEPVLAFNTLEQTRAFLATRGILLNFGSKFHERLILVTSFQLVVFVILACYCILTFLLTTADDVGSLISSYIVLLVLVTPAFVCCGFGILEAAKANDEAHRHVSIVVNARMSLRFAAHEENGPTSPLPDDSVIKQVLLLLYDVERSLKEQTTISILGVPATWALAQTFFGFIFSLITVGTTLFFSKLTG